MEAHISAIYLGGFDGFFCSLPTGTMGSAQFFQVVLSGLSGVAIGVDDLHTCLVVRIQAIRQ